MEADSKLKVDKLKVDGGPTGNRFLMQFQADISGIPVEVPQVSEVTAQGAAFLAGLGIDFWSDPSELIKLKRAHTYTPRMPEKERTHLFEEWKRAVDRSRNWVRKSA
jgi:glycerol kinase